MKSCRLEIPTEAACQSCGRRPNRFVGGTDDVGADSVSKLSFGV